MTYAAVSDLSPQGGVRLPTVKRRDVYGSTSTRRFGTARKNACLVRERRRTLDEQLRSPQLAQPERDVRCRWLVARAKIAGLHQAADHRPVLVALGLLCRDEVRQREQIHLERRVGVRRKRQRRAARPERRERVHSAHAR
ncbi:MAG: hypothetical protein Q8Q85_15055, partial [Gemmatimonadales bacterium]|nr:hypothetical protein [Gemmatimonadales bacterium]